MSDEIPEPRTDDTPVPASPNPERPTEVAAEPEPDWSIRYKYLLADFENFRRRVEREREGISRHARAAMLRELLPILEAFRTARDALTHLAATDPVRRGLEMLDREWSTFLKHEGVEAIAEPGRPFRSDESEAVGEAPAGADRPDGTVVEVVQQGYRFYGGLLRPAKVVVARETAPAAGEEKHPTEARSA